MAVEAAEEGIAPARTECAWMRDTVVTPLGGGEGTIFVGGEFRPPAGGATQLVVEKATGEPLAQVGVATVADVDAAVAAAKAAQAEWAAATAIVRAAVMRAAATALRARAHEIADMIMSEAGSIRRRAHCEVAGSTDALHAAAALTSRPIGEILPVGIADRVPVGVVGAITPSHFPLILGLRVVAPALALGNAVVLKPSVETTLTGGLTIAELFAEAGLPPGVLNVVTGDGEVADRLTHHPDVALTHVSGAQEIGGRIAEAADLDPVAICPWSVRHIVARPLLDAHVERLAAEARATVVGNPERDDVVVGPMINAQERDRAHAVLLESVAQGARIVEGGTYDGLFYRPTVVTDVTTDMPLWTQAIFAPITPVLAVDSEAEAIRLVNDTPHGIVNAVITDRGRQIAARPHDPSNLEAFTERRVVALAS